MDDLRDWIVALQRDQYDSVKEKMIYWISRVPRDDGTLVHASYFDYEYDDVVYTSICNLLVMVSTEEFVDNYVYGSVLTYEQIKAFRLENDPNMLLYEDIKLAREVIGEVVYTHVGQMGFQKQLVYTSVDESYLYRDEEGPADLLVVPPFRDIDVVESLPVFDIKFQVTEDTVVDVLLDDRLIGDGIVDYGWRDEVFLSVETGNARKDIDVTNFIGYGRYVLEPGHSRITIHYPRYQGYDRCPYDRETKMFFRNFFSQVKKKMRFAARRSRNENDAIRNFERMLSYVKYPDSMISYELYLDMRSYLKNELKYDWNMLYKSFLLSWRCPRYSKKFDLDQIKNSGNYGNGRMYYTYPVDFEYHLLASFQDEANAYLHRAVQQSLPLREVDKFN